MVKKYYIIEPLDIDGDTNPDGFLVSQYKLDRNNNKIFLKNKYITFSKLNNYIIKKGGKSKSKSKANENDKLIVLTPEQFNQFMNNKIQSNNPQQYPQQYPQQFPQQYPPQVMVRDNNSGSLGNTVASGVAIGFSASAGHAIFDAMFGE